MDYFDTEIDGQCIITATQPLKKPLEPLSDCDDQWQRTEGGILPGSEYAWQSCGPRFRVFSTLSGASVMDWSFESPVERAVISCAVPLPGNFGPGHNGKQDLGLRLAVGLIVEGHRGLVVVLATGPAIRTRVLSSIRVHSNVLSMALVSSEIQDDDESPLHPALCRMQGVLALGLLGGEVLLLDLRADDPEVNQAGGGETHSMPFTVRDDLVLKMAETAVTGDHLALMLNSGSFVEEQFMLQSPDGRVKCKSSKNLVGVLSLLYTPQLSSLCVGFSFGVFQLWSLADLTLLFTSPLLESPLPVVRLSWQPPSDDPRACCYLWAAYAHQGSRRNPMAALYALTWERCQRIVGYGDLYLSLQSCRLVFELEVAPANRMDDVSLMGVQTVTRRPPSGDASLALFSWSAGNKAGALLFDLDQWYKAQMPNRVGPGAEMYLARYSVNHDGDADQQYLAARLTDASVTRFDAVRLREEHFFPGSTSFHSTWLLDDCVLRATHPGAQAQALKALTRAGPIGIAAPAVLFHRCVKAGLRPTLGDFEPTLLDSTESQRDFLLSLCLERLPKLVLRCALHWADGIQEALGGSLDCWLEWAWQQARSAKATADSICVPLFDLSGRSLDSMAHAMLLLAIGQVCQLASIFKELQAHLVARRLTSRLDETEERCSVLALVSLYLGSVRWFVTASLLPERPDTDPALGNVPFPAAALADNYRQRRVELQRTHQVGEVLYIDTLVARHPRVGKLWQQEGGDGLYPPPSLQAILRVHLLDEMDDDHKHLLVFYLLQDLATLHRYDGLDNEGLVSSYPYLTSAQRQLARALWLLDHRDFDDAVLALASARPEPWQRNLALRALHAQGRHRLAAQLLHNGGPPPGLAGHRLGVSILLHCDRLTDALAMLRKEGTAETMPALLEHFFRICRDNNAMGQALKLTLRPNEEEVLFRFLERECGGARGLDMRALYLLSHNRIVEATALAPPPGQPATSTRDVLLSAYTRTLSQITLDHAAFCRRQRGDITRYTTVSRPEPLTVSVRQTASHEALFAASLQATAAVSRMPSLSSAQSQQLPSAALSAGRHTPAIVPCRISTPTPGSKRKRDHTNADELLMTPRVRRRIQESPSVHRPTSILKPRTAPEMSTPPSIRKIRFSLKLEEPANEPTPSFSLKRTASFDEPAPNKTVCHEPTVAEEESEESAEEKLSNELEDSELIKTGDDNLMPSTQEDDVLQSAKLVNESDDLIVTEGRANGIVEEAEVLDVSVEEEAELEVSTQEVEELNSSIQEVEDSDIEEVEVGDFPHSRQLLLDDSRPCLIRNQFENRRSASEAESEVSVEDTSAEDGNVSKEDEVSVCIDVADEDINESVEEVSVVEAKEGSVESYHLHKESKLVNIEGDNCEQIHDVSIEEETVDASKEDAEEAEEEEEELELVEDLEEEEQLEQDDIYEAMDVDQAEEDNEGTDLASSENDLDVPSVALDLAQVDDSSQETLEIPTSSELSENPLPRNLNRPVSDYFKIPGSSSDLEENIDMNVEKVDIDLEEATNVPDISEAAMKTKDSDSEIKENQGTNLTSNQKRLSRPKFIDLDDDEEDEEDNDSVDLEEIDDDNEENNKIAVENIQKDVKDSATSSRQHQLMKNTLEEEEEEAEEEEDLDELQEEEEDGSEGDGSEDDDSASESSSSSDIVYLDDVPKPVETEAVVLTPLLPAITKVWSTDPEEDEEEMLNRAILMSTEQHEELKVVSHDDGGQAETGFECVEETEVDQIEVEPDCDPLFENKTNEVDGQEFESTSIIEQKVEDDGKSMDEAADNEDDENDEAALDQDELNRAILFVTDPNDGTAADDSAEGLEIHSSPKWETGSDASSGHRTQLQTSSPQKPDGPTDTQSEDLELATSEVSEPEDIRKESEASNSNRRQLRSNSQAQATTNTGKTAIVAAMTPHRPESEDEDRLAIQVSESESSHPESEANTTHRRVTRSSYSQQAATFTTVAKPQDKPKPDDLQRPVIRIPESEGSLNGSEVSVTLRRRTRSSVLGHQTPEKHRNKEESIELKLPTGQSPETSPASSSDKGSVYLRRLHSTLAGSQPQPKERSVSPTGSETSSVNRRRTRLSWLRESQEIASNPLQLVEQPHTTGKGRTSLGGHSPARSESYVTRLRTSTSWKMDIEPEPPVGVRQRRFTGEATSSSSPSVPPRSGSALGQVDSKELENFAATRRLTRQQRSILERSFASRSQVTAHSEDEEVVATSEGGDSDDASSTASTRKRRASFIRAVSKMSPARSRGGSLPPSRGPRSLDGDFNDGESDAGSDVTRPHLKKLRRSRGVSVGAAAPLAELNTILEESTVAESESIESLAADKPGPSRPRTRGLSPVSEETHHLQRQTKPAKAKRRSSLMLHGKRTSFDAAPRKSNK